MTNELNGADIGRDREPPTNGLKDRQQQALDFTFAQHLIVQGELEDARQAIARLESVLTQAKVEIEALRSFNTMLESRIESAIAERDLAVGQRAKCAVLLDLIHTAIHEATAETLAAKESKNVAENAARQRRA
jgi:hypothetical protein